jgi:hypothetical protein
MLGVLLDLEVWALLDRTMQLPNLFRIVPTARLMLAICRVALTILPLS